MNSFDSDVDGLREYTVVVYQSTGGGVGFPLFAADEQQAFKQFDAMYMQVQNTGQVYPYAVEGSELNQRIPNAFKIELLDYFTENTIASYSVSAVA